MDFYYSIWCCCCKGDNIMDIVINQLNYKYPISDDMNLIDISLQIKSGEFCAIIGQNGSGKTTLCSAIRGFIPHFFKGDLEGDVLIGDINTKETTVGELASKIGFMFQNPFTQISGIAETVYDEISFGLENLGLPPKV